jgi:hypothetical protein
MSEIAEHRLEINSYDGNLPFVNTLINLINKEYSQLFYAVIVHGSVATNEVVLYSDFDGLLIVKDVFVNSKKLEDFKKDSMKIILGFDPLQHHGWFQIKESDLVNYPENYLPVSTLKYSKFIFPKTKNIELHLKVNTEVDYKTSLINMLNQFQKRESENWRPENIYQLKSVLSQIMLLPCLYYSAMHNDGIFKRDSFEAVKSNFSKSEWMPIECATEIRANWDYSLNGLQKLLLSLSSRLSKKIVRRFFLPKIPLAIQQKLNDECFENLKLLVKKIKEDIV